ncbi:hypothetical protein HKCCE2091_14845 [Rhodobacterales bacterium HKCCE2091]|nr:hypothetical protein [Rhodobacterales bacterium HKCCE2091]
MSDPRAMIRAAAALLVAAFLAACSEPLSAPSGEAGNAVSFGLGATERPVPDGIWRLVGVVTEEDGLVPFDEEAAGQLIAGDELPRPVMLDLHILRWHGASGSYETPLANLRFYQFDGVYQVLEARTTFLAGEPRSFFFPAEARDGGDELRLYVLPCNAIPENYRAAQGFGGQTCTVETSDVVLRSFGLVDFDTLPQLIFQRIAALP